MSAKNQFRYPFEWLDKIVGKELNPDCTRPGKVNPNELSGWKQQLSAETDIIWKELKAKTFLPIHPQKISAMLLQYHESLDELKRQAMVNQAAYPQDNPLASFCEQVLTELDHLQNQFRRRYAHYLPATQTKPNTPSPHQQPASFKVTCRLSVDQVAILLKAADDTRLLTARSFSLVLRSITPFLSTERMPDFSWKSARSSTMKIEERDKEIAINTLEELIRKIKTY